MVFSASIKVSKKSNLKDCIDKTTFSFFIEHMMKVAAQIARFAD